MYMYIVKSAALIVDRGNWGLGKVTCGVGVYIFVSSEE